MPATKTTALSPEQKDEIKALILLDMSDGEIIKRYSISRRQLSSLKGAVSRKKEAVASKLPDKAAETPIPTIPLEISVSDLLAAGPEARIVIRLIK